jgi:hypothetical protein
VAEVDVDMADRLVPEGKNLEAAFVVRTKRPSTSKMIQHPCQGGLFRIIKRQFGFAKPLGAAVNDNHPRYSSGQPVSGGK